MHIKFSFKACLREAETRCRTNLDSDAQQGQVAFHKGGHHEEAPSSCFHDEEEHRGTCSRALKRRSGGRTTPAQWRAHSDEELHLEEHSEEPDACFFSRTSKVAITAALKMGRLQPTQLKHKKL